MTYQIKVGEFFDISTGEMVAKQTLTITEDQKEILEIFADTKKDVDLNTVYVINSFNFRILPRIPFVNIENIHKDNT